MQTAVDDLPGDVWAIGKNNYGFVAKYQKGSYRFRRESSSSSARSAV